MTKRKKSIKFFRVLNYRVMVKGPDGEMIEKEEVNYEVTGALGKDKNTGVMYNGVLLKVHSNMNY